MEGGPSRFPQGFSCLAVLWILLAAARFRLRGFHPLCPAFPKPFCYLATCFSQSATPNNRSHSVWPLSISLAATLEIDFSFSSCRYLDVSVPCVPSVSLWIGLTATEVCSARFPHSDICGSSDICSLPQLFAAYHVLLRLRMPRHSPYALSSLIFLRSAPLIAL